jgi:imidazolonepropionase-like amidohydrolase
VTPTFVAMENRRMTADELEAALEAERGDPRWGTLTAELVEAWEGQLAERRDEGDTVDWKELDALGTSAVRGMHEEGVRFLAGTDLGVAFVYPGSSLHEELVLMVERAGLTPLEALVAANGR